MEILVILLILWRGSSAAPDSPLNPLVSSSTYGNRRGIHADMNEEIIGHGLALSRHDWHPRNLYRLCNMLGLIPTLQTPTGHIEVTLGCAVAAFLYYNFQGVRHHGVLGYLKHFCGPMMHGDHHVSH